MRKSYRIELSEYNWRSVFRLGIVFIFIASTHGILQDRAPCVNPAHSTLWQDVSGSDVETGGCSWSSLGSTHSQEENTGRNALLASFFTRTGFQTASHTAHKLQHGTHETIWFSIGTELRELGVCCVRRCFFSPSFLFSPLFPLSFLPVLDMASCILDCLQKFWSSSSSHLHFPNAGVKSCITAHVHVMLENETEPHVCLVSTLPTEFHPQPVLFSFCQIICMVFFVLSQIR